MKFDKMPDATFRKNFIELNEYYIFTFTPLLSYMGKVEDECPYYYKITDAHIISNAKDVYVGELFISKRNMLSFCKSKKTEVLENKE